MVGGVSMHAYTYFILQWAEFRCINIFYSMVDEVSMHKHILFYCGRSFVMQKIAVFCLYIHSDVPFQKCTIGIIVKERKKWPMSEFGSVSAVKSPREPQRR